jgi:hypothetical protein
MRYLLLFLAVFGALDLLAQNGGSEAAQRWQDLQARKIPALARRPVPTTLKTVQQRAQEKRELLDHFLSLAREAKAYRDNFPGSIHAKEALVIEASSLLKAAFLGDGTRATYTDSLVNEIERDVTLPSGVRFSVVALADHLLRRQTVRSSQEARVAHEASARYLIKEFPLEEGGYLTLLSAAEAGGDPDKMASVVQEIEASPAPFSAKAAARVMAARNALVGKSLADVANTALGRGNFFEVTRKRKTVLYSWATWSPGSVELAQSVLSKIKGDVLVVGYNLDRDVEKAKEMARKERVLRGF